MTPNVGGLVANSLPPLSRSVISPQTGLKRTFMKVIIAVELQEFQLCLSVNLTLLICRLVQEVRRLSTAVVRMEPSHEDVPMWRRGHG
jgi:hypothetical protein